MIIDKKYYSIAYISEILFFQTTLLLFGKFNKGLYSTSHIEKDFDSWIKQVKNKNLVKLTLREHNIKISNKWLNNTLTWYKIEENWNDWKILKMTGKSEKYQKIFYNDIKPKCSPWFNITNKSLLIVLLIFPHRYQLVFSTYISQEFST